MQDGQTSKPGILLIHGGGWANGDKQGYRGWCEKLAKKGFVAVEVNYRLAKQDMPGTWWPAQLSDVQLATRWLRAHGNQYGLNPARVCALGDSAGGQLSVFLGVPAATIRDENAKFYPRQSSAVSCVVDNFGPVDLTSPAYVHNGRMPMFGGRTLSESPDAYKSASPLFYISAHSAPMMVVQGYGDKAVPALQSVRLAKTLTSYGVPVKFIGYQGDHEWKGLDPVERNRIMDEEINYLLTH
jgi:acetyl esterase/lipase